jgi:dihydrodipicolinate synthase/N-acetylneuraminate lyase
MPAKWQWNLLTLLSRCPIPLLKKVASSHAQVKAALHIIGMPISPTVRHPLRSISESEIEKIRVLIAQNSQDSEAEYIKQ